LLLCPTFWSSEWTRFAAVAYLPESGCGRFTAMAGGLGKQKCEPERAPAALHEWRSRFADMAGIPVKRVSCFTGTAYLPAKQARSQ
jgi:hypothetical protein